MINNDVDRTSFGDLSSKEKNSSDKTVKNIRWLLFLSFFVRSQSNIPLFGVVHTIRNQIAHVFLIKIVNLSIKEVSFIHFI